MEQHNLDDSKSDTLRLQSSQHTFDQCECLIWRLARQPVRQAVHDAKIVSFSRRFLGSIPKLYLVQIRNCLLKSRW